jgi:hypothetical protein
MKHSEASSPAPCHLAHGPRCPKIRDTSGFQTLSFALFLLSYSLLTLSSSSASLYTQKEVEAAAAKAAKQREKRESSTRSTFRGSRSAGNAPVGALTDRQSAVPQDLGRASPTSGLYRVGDRWKILAFRENPRPRSPSGSSSILEVTYEVTEVTSDQRIHLRVQPHFLSGAAQTTQNYEIREVGLWLQAESDSVSDSLGIPKLRVIRKAYLTRQAPTSELGHPRWQWVASPTDGVPASWNELELYPLTPPELDTSPSKQPSDRGLLPPALLAAAPSRLSETLLKQHCMQWELDDFLGRRVSIFWKPGLPWPYFLRTSTGAALLIEYRGLAVSLAQEAK